MNTYKIYFILVSMCLIFTECKKNESKPFLPGVKGSANSVIVVMTGSYWESAPGDTIKAKFGRPFPALPQNEPIFDILFTPHTSFNRFYQNQRNILITLIGPDYKDKVLIQKDRWARGQLIITLMSPNKESFIKLFENKSEEIIQLISNTEKSRLMASYKAATDKSIYEKLQKRHKISINVPKGYSIDRDVENFVWLNNEYREIVEGVLIYYYPYTDSNTFTKEYLLNKRNEILKKYVPGETEGSYMSTENRFPIEMKSFNLKTNRYTAELRGLWMMQGGLAMGGPFISITQYDEKNNRIITAEGFVFAPGHEKRNIIRQVEAIIYSLDF